MRRSLPFPALTLLALVAGALPAADEPKHTNRLSKESSPYLLQHAHNPVDWYPWGDEAFAKAKKENKLVFLSIGYSSCHWCHVMERESFENEAVAKLLNDWFVCVKVDREERPDIDTVYITALSVMERSGGWPLTMFLTPDAKPIFGGTYWPPDDKEIDGKTVKGLKSILKTAHEAWKEDPKALQEHADTVARGTRLALESSTRGAALVEPNRDLVTAAVDALKEEFDPEYGGFGNPSKKFRGTKFPIPPNLGLVQAEARRTKSEELAKVRDVTLDHMAMGGIYDHLGGGFHRYSTERTWTVPHFEKMLYDNAELAEVYARAWQATKKPLYRKVVAETLAFVGRELTGPDGAFYSALDADSDGTEGRFYVWTAKEIDGVLTDKAGAELLKKVYGVDGPPNFEEKYHILLLKSVPDAETEKRLAPLRQKLFEARAKRVRPFLDTKVLTAWNGQMIAGYAVAGQMLDEPKYTAAAAKAADFVLAKLRTKDGRLMRTYGARPGGSAEAKLNAYLDDYAFLVHGLLCLHDATKDKKWLDEARALTDVMVKYHLDEKWGGFFYTSNDHEKLFARGKDQYDGAQPSGNSMAAQDLVRLWQKTGEQRYRELAEKTFKAFAGSMKENPAALTTMAEALARYLDAGKK
ncbi:MAG TPA: thioredoxin domain-containing protein [Gemmataceae bacterium]|nr:thioredoxin domain-containing protein [Gemmataceae bacterium]